MEGRAYESQGEDDDRRRKDESMEELFDIRDLRALLGVHMLQGTRDIPFEQARVGFVDDFLREDAVGERHGDARFAGALEIKYKAPYSQSG